MRFVQLLLCWLLLVGCTFHVEVGTQRIFIGENRAVDWIELGTIQRIVNRELVVLFHDDSPIQKAFLLDRVSCSYLVELKDSKWLVESVSGRTGHYIVTNVTDSQILPAG